MNKDLDFIVEEENADTNIITDSAMKSLFNCPYSYYLQYCLGLSKAPKSAYAAASLMLKQARRKLFNVRDKNVGRILSPPQLHAGPLIKTAEEMAPEELSQYLAFSSPESFGAAMFNTWNLVAKRDKYAGSNLVWSFPSQSHTIGLALSLAVENYYRFILENGAPVVGFTDLDVVFNFEGNLFKVKLPELRKGARIYDPSLYGFNFESNTDLNKSALATLRILGFCMRIYESSLYRRKLGLDDSIVERLGGNPEFLNAVVQYNSIDLQTGRISITSRTDADLDPLRKVIDKFLSSVSHEQFTPNHRHCTDCQYNALGQDSKVICRERKPGSKPAVPAYYFKKRKFKVSVNEERDRIIIHGSIAKDEETIKHIGDLYLFIEHGDGLRVQSRYASDIRGHGFECHLLKEADKQLADLSIKTGKVVTHSIDFDRNFGAAGQQLVREFLAEHGYVNMKKQYNPSQSN